MKIAIMQPYFLPYIGYFHLIHASDIFVFYDDVNYINKGWINRNNYLERNKPKKFTIPCEKLTQNKKINEIVVRSDLKMITNILKSLELNYKKAPYFKESFDLIRSCFLYKSTNLAEFASNSVKQISKYLGLNRQFKYSSADFYDTQNLNKADRLIEIAKRASVKNYINAIGGRELYSKEYFKRAGINLSFLESEYISYKQFDEEFVPWLSIIDVIMFNSVKEVNKLILNYKII